MSQTDIPKTYDHRTVEERLYAEWEREGAFEADPDSGKEPYCIVLPPPNVTGALHMGHALNGTIQDALIRRARMKGYEALWLPGVDHASIAVQNVVERKLTAEEDKTRWDLGREEFVERCREFADEARSQILGQLRRLGASVDWSRLRYTMDERYVDAVTTTFTELYESGLIYRGNRITNWCPHDRSAISDLEVTYEEFDGKLYGIRYPFADGKGPGPDGKDYAQVFSTRPETMLGDVALVVNPEDERYKDLVGRKVRVPFVEREVEVLADEYVDPAFGTGVLKVTPAHDPNDFEIAGRLDLKPVNVMNPDGTINGNGAGFEGLGREDARAAVVAALDERGLLGEVRDYTFRVGHCDRCGAVIEPWLSEQWWVSMKEIAEPAIEALERGEITVYPDSWRRETMRWLENIHDWNVSRQLWWGHRIPVWYGPEGEVVVGKGSPGEGYEQDPDILDTWFSSGLWPFATLGWPEETRDLEYFYPTALLSTAREIMYLWVARMVMSGLRFRGEVPFRKVNVHSIVLAADGSKMSKSKGNGIDPLDLFDEYGTDAVRFGLLYQSSTQDFAYSYERASMGRAFVTKLWNATRFVLSYPEGDGEGEESVSDRWILSELNRTARDYDAFLERCEFSEAMRLVYDFAWHSFADWYIEISKAAPSGATPRVLREVFAGILKLLHPVMPFATEEMYHLLGGEGFLVHQDLPAFDPSLEDAEAVEILERTQRCVSAIRTARSDLQINGTITVAIEPALPALMHDADIRVDEAALESLGNVKLTDDLGGIADYAVPAGDVTVPMKFDDAQQTNLVTQLEKKLVKAEAELDRMEKKLSNRNFVERAPQEVVEKEETKRMMWESEVERYSSLLQILKKPS